MLNFITNTTQTKLLAVSLGLGIAQVGALSALRARAARRYGVTYLKGWFRLNVFSAYDT